MTLSDLDHAISTLENSATADAVSETLEFLRGLRERAVEGFARDISNFRDRERGDRAFFFHETRRSRATPGLLILAPEDE